MTAIIFPQIINRLRPLYGGIGTHGTPVGDYGFSPPPTVM
jgi:hypothetical protein